MSRPSLTHPDETRRAKRRSRGQTLAEFGVSISLLMVVFLGIFQVSYLIYQQYVALNLAREGANLILRQSTFDDAATAMAQAVPQFDANTRLILSVVQLGPPETPNAATAIITHRHAWGMPAGASVLGDPPSSSYKSADDDYPYTAKDPARDTSIRANSPNGLQIIKGQSVYVAEIYRKRRDIVPLAGVELPDSLYSVTYF